MYEDLERLNALREKGAITEEEYQKEKKRILDALNTPPSAVYSSDKSKLWGMDEKAFCTILHVSQFAGYLLPMLGFVLPVVMWVTGRDESKMVDAHGRAVVNWMISLFIYFAICMVLVVVGIGILGFIALGILNVVFVIKGALKSNEGILWPYPMTIKFL